MRKGRVTKNLMGGIAVLVLVAVVIVLLNLNHRQATATLGGSSAASANLEGGPIVLLSKDAPAVPDDAAALLSTARKEQSVEALQPSLHSGELLVIDESAFAGVPSDFLHAQLLAGRPIVGLNIALSDLSDRSGYLEALGQVEPMYKQYTKLPARPGEPFYSIVSLVTVSGIVHSGDLQANFSDHLFKAHLHQARLEAQGLTFIPAEGGGKVVPLSALGTPGGNQ